MSSLTPHNQHFCFGGTVGYYSHPSAVCNCEMRFAVFVPPQAQTGPVPVLFYLSGLTCTEDNFTSKAGAQRYAAEHGLMLVAPDTSPRGEGIPDEPEAWDFGIGAGFYVDATAAPWRKNYSMYSYVVQELPELVAQEFSVRLDRMGIFGHSMGGHGALVCGLRNPDLFKSISAFAPIAAPSQCPWGQKAFSGYLGSDTDSWKAYDATELVKVHPQRGRTILLDQGTADNFLAQNQLLPDVFADACKEAGQPLVLRMQPGYDHSYFFMASFMADHLRHHADVLTKG
ncbi:MULTISPECIES: S-formylglutathione hydrolase [Cyanophyceae]|uniref:S-formylglutathione hydrolase n=1 Tax=Cyanophyceae TaxID=3028117 RepID=UPI001685C384|nr:MULTISPECIES: S-formylglutathione hydrolase [Cyanophyceae]MBD1919297.1 S-formylglutathione hydrolase [Phormidium sp. FACHB-77]MBD2033016.1 S-formylglutathione hydrolase [Phormidium sp. FACHB-322]MBD2054204.1 S-formylglutathione hydrolase [Leptolyngbya sp. FACHB-60]